MRHRGTSRLTAQERVQAERLLSEMGGALWRMAVVVAGSDDSAEDLLAEALVRALPHLNSVETSHAAYLRRVMLNVRTSRYVKQRKECQAAELALRNAPAGPSNFDLADLRSDMARMLAHLPSRQRAVVVLRYLEDWDVATVALNLGCSESTVRSQAARALATLRSNLSDSLEGYGQLDGKLRDHE